MRKQPCNITVHIRRDENSASLIKRFMKKFKNEKIRDEYCEATEYFVKPSQKNKLKRLRRKKVAQARFIEQQKTVLKEVGKQ